MAADRETAIDALLDREAIRACLTRFSRGMDRFDRDLYLSAFHDDATVAAGPYVGDAAGCWEWAVPMHREAQILTHHSLLNNTIDIQGDIAHSETYYQFVARNHPFEAGGGETVMLAGGRYIDRLEKRANGGQSSPEWRIALRTNIIEWSLLTPSLPPPFGDIDGIDGNGVSARDGSDPSYFRPLTNKRTVTNPAA